MVLNNRCVFLMGSFVVFVFLSGCGLANLTKWTDTKSLEEHGNKVHLTVSGLIPYIGKNRDEVVKYFGEPTKIEHRLGSKYQGDQQERIPFDEIWDYVYQQGIFRTNIEGSTKVFYFYDGVVVEVDAF